MGSVSLGRCCSTGPAVCLGYHTAGSRLDPRALPRRPRVCGHPPFAPAQRKRTRSARSLRANRNGSVSPPSRGKVTLRRTPSPRDTLAGTRFSLGNPPVTARPRCRQVLRILRPIWFYSASSTAAWQVPDSNASCTYELHSPKGRDGWRSLVAIPEEGSEHRCQKGVAPPFAAANSVPSCGLFAREET